MISIRWQGADLLITPPTKGLSITITNLGDNKLEYQVSVPEEPQRRPVKKTNKCTPNPFAGICEWRWDTTKDPRGWVTSCSKAAVFCTDLPEDRRCVKCGHLIDAGELI